MICRLCLAKPATCSVTEPSPSGRLDEAHYCAECYEAKYVKPPSHASDFPRPRLTLNSVMIIVGAWALPNAVAAWVMRSGYVTGTPAQIRLWTLYAFLGVNLVPGFFVVWFASLAWLGRVMWYQRTGGLVPIPKQKLTPGQFVGLIIYLVPFLAWVAVATVLEGWLTPRIWPGQRNSPLLLALLLGAPLVPLFALRLSKNDLLGDRFRQEWKAASGLERVLRAVGVAWSLGLILAIVGGGPSLLGWGFTFWFPIPPVLLFGVVVQLLLMAGVAMAIRRR